VRASEAHVVQALDDERQSTRNDTDEDRKKDETEHRPSFPGFRPDHGGSSPDKDAEEEKQHAVAEEWQACEATIKAKQSLSERHDKGNSELRAAAPRSSETRARGCSVCGSNSRERQAERQEAVPTRPLPTSSLYDRPARSPSASIEACRRQAPPATNVTHNTSPNSARFTSSEWRVEMPAPPIFVNAVTPTLTRLLRRASTGERSVRAVMSRMFAKSDSHALSLRGIPRGGFFRDRNGHTFALLRERHKKATPSTRRAMRRAGIRECFFDEDETVE
jgi:hypothetical protein